MRKMFINLCEPISAVEKSLYSGMQYMLFHHAAVSDLLMFQRVTGCLVVQDGARAGQGQGRG